MKAPHLSAAIRIVLGLTVSSGVVLLLSGGALAASGASDTPTPTKKNDQVSTTVVDVQTTSSSTEATLSTTTVHDSHDSNGTTGGSSVSLTSSSPSPASSDSTADSDRTMTGPEKSVSAGTTSVVMSPTPAETPSASRDDVHTLRTVSLPTVTAQKNGSIHYGSSHFMSQPLVSSSNGPGLTGAVSAATTPSSSHQQLPAPSPASGLLDRLSAELAGAVVPSTTWLGSPSSAPVWPVADLVLVTASLLGALFVQTYGLWLRRSGYVTAARSDVMAAGRSMFVVPQGLGMTRV